MAYDPRSLTDDDWKYFNQNGHMGGGQSIFGNQDQQGVNYMNSKINRAGTGAAGFDASGYKGQFAGMWGGNSTAGAAAPSFYDNTVSSMSKTGWDGMAQGMGGDSWTAGNGLPVGQALGGTSAGGNLQPKATVSQWNPYRADGTLKTVGGGDFDIGPTFQNGTKPPPNFGGQTPWEAPTRTHVPLPPGFRNDQLNPAPPPPNMAPPPVLDNPYKMSQQPSLGGQGNYTAGKTISDYYDPSMKYTMDEAMKAVQGSAAARGSLFSSGTNNDMLQTASGIASKQYADANARMMQDKQFNYGVDSADRSFDYNANVGDRNFNYAKDNANREFDYRAATGDRSFDYTRLRDLYQGGLQSAGGMTANNSNYARLIADNMTSGSQAEANAQMGIGNTDNKALSDLFAWLAQQGGTNGL